MVTRAGGGRIARVVGLAAAGALGALAIYVGPTLFLFLPRTIREVPRSALLLVASLGVYFLPRLWPAKTEGGAVPGRLDAVAAWALRGRLTMVVASGCGLLLAAWVPHYLTWPWWLDLDTYAEMAQSWDAGSVPYRDIRVFNFPGQIYLFWIIGHLVGWGQTAALYAVDAAFVVALGIALTAWTRSILGQALPGLVAYLGFLVYYLGLDYNTVAQRDWHACFFVILGLLCPRLRPGRGGRAASALAAAVALTFRPQTVLFLPALASAVAEGAGRPEDEGGGWARRVGEWAWMFAAFVALAFAPLVASGALGGFVRGLRITSYGGVHSRVTASSVVEVLLAEFLDGKTAPLLAVLAAMTARGPRGLRRPARTCALALLGACLYRPISPFPHRYLAIPLDLFRSVGLAPAVAAFLASTALAPTFRLVGVALIVAQVVPGVPSKCDLVRSARAVPFLFRGEPPDDPPPGCARDLPRSRSAGSAYSWDDYQALLTHLRRTAPGTRVANLLKSQPILAVNGVAGRLGAFPYESGIMWVVYGGTPADEGLLVEALERATDSVVVWSPGEAPIHAQLTLPRLTEAVLRLYEPEAQFGAIEVRRRRPLAD